MVLVLNKAAVFWDNKVQDATVTAASEASASLAATNVQTYLLGEKHRTTDADGEYWHIDFGEETFLPALFMWAHNFTADATLRVRISANSDLSSPVFDATFYAWPSINGLEEVGLELGGLDGAPVISELESYQFYTVLNLALCLFGAVSSATSTTLVLPTTLDFNGDELDASMDSNDYVGQYVWLLSGSGAGQSRLVDSYDPSTRTLTLASAWDTTPSANDEFIIDYSDSIDVDANDVGYAGRYMRIDIVDGDNPDGYIQVGWIGAGDIIQPGNDIEFDHEINVVDPSQRFFSDGQTPWINTKNRYRVGSFAWAFLTEAEAKNEIRKMAILAGSSRPVVMMPFVENTFRAYTDTIYGLMESPPTTRQVRRDYTATSYATGFSVREII